jgi:hypothetical protein
MRGFDIQVFDRLLHVILRLLVVGHVAGFVALCDGVVVCCVVVCCVVVCCVVVCCVVVCCVVVCCVVCSGMLCVSVLCVSVGQVRKEERRKGRSVVEE